MSNTINTTFFERVKQLADRKEELHKELVVAVYNAREYEAVPLETLAKYARVSRSTVKNMISEERSRREEQSPQLQGVHAIDLDQLDDGTKYLIMHALQDG